jgi:hypothetical protein
MDMRGVRQQRLLRSFGLAIVALACVATTTAFADEHGGRGRDGRDGGDRGGNVTTIYRPGAAAARCATPDPSAATVDSVFDQFAAGGGLSLNQAALIGNALYLSADQVQQLSFDQMISMTQCAGVSLDTLANILSGA